MSTYNDLQPLRQLSDAVLCEVIREAEDRLKAQLATAIAADQRALAIAGSQLTAATASLAGGVALAHGTAPDLWLAFVAIIFAGALVVAAYFAVRSARPAEFDFPGNAPKSWLPERWIGVADGVYTLKQARIEQATCIEDAIYDNKAVMDCAAIRVHRSLDLALVATAVAAGLFLATLIGRNWTIAEPISEIVRRG